MKRGVHVLLLMLLIAVNIEGQSVKYSEAEINQKVDDLLLKMTLEEKIGQMTLFTSDWDVTGPTIRATYKEDIKSGKVGAIFNAHTASYNRKLQETAVKGTRLGIPLLFGYDVIHGYKTIFPIPLGESSSWDLVAMEKSARIAAEEASAAGLHWTYAPMVDIARDPRWGRVAEGAGEDTYLGSQIAAARVKGFQGNIGEVNSLLACVKHYAAYGAATAGRDYNTVDISERNLRDVYLPPFKAAVDAGVATIMTSFNEIAGVPSTGNHHLLTDILRNEWGFKGFVVTDYTSINEMINHGFSVDEKQAGEQAVNAGVDMDMQGAVYYNHLFQSVKEGSVTMQTVNDAVRRILRLKYQIGLFEDPYRFCNEEREKKVVFSKENQAAAKEIATKSIVLLKNDRQILPLKSSIKNIALIGPLADNKSELIGSWSGAGDYNQAVSLLEGLQGSPGLTAKILQSKGCEIEGEDQSGFKDAINVAKKSDIILLAIGEKASMTGEAASRSKIDLPGQQLALFNALFTTGKPIIVVLMNGRPLAIPEVYEKATAVLETWFLGTEAGPAIADVLMGAYNPSGKLPMSIPRSLGQIPVYYNAKNTGRPMDPNNKYTSKYLDSPNTPQYPFGYGLSYSTFTYSEPKINLKDFRLNDTLKFTVTVTNTSTVNGEEVIQLYAHDLFGSVTRPVKELIGFRKLAIPAGQSKEVTFTFTPQNLAFYGADMQFKPEPGDFDLMVGGNSVDVKTIRVKLK